jgi:voltage-gated potassium channel
MAIVLSASLLYEIEHRTQPEAFASIPAAMWWAVCTLTTVGYGDVAPITALGKMVTSFVSIIGIAMVALPTSLFASGFAQISSRNRHVLESEAREALADGVFSKQESNAYLTLAEQLNVAPEIAQEIDQAALHKQEVLDGVDCPHCGKPVSS